MVRCSRMILDHHVKKGYNNVTIMPYLKVSVNENFRTSLDFVFFGFLACVGPKFYFGRKRKSESAF